MLLQGPHIKHTLFSIKLQIMQFPQNTATRTIRCTLYTKLLTLCWYECGFLLVAVDVVGVDVVGVFVRSARQTHARMVVAEHVGVAIPRQVLPRSTRTRTQQRVNTTSKQSTLWTGTCVCRQLQPCVLCKCSNKHRERLTHNDRRQRVAQFAEEYMYTTVTDTI